MPRVRKLAVAFLLASLVVSGAALAARGDPQKKITPADQARSKAMLLRKADLRPGFTATPASVEDDDFYCKALDESDLTLTGDAESPDFERELTFLSSLAQVYESVADANTSWRRGTSAAGEKCVRDEFRRQFQRDGIRLISFRRVAFPRLAQRTAAYRLVAGSQGVRVYVDVVVLQQSRAQAALLLGSALTPLAKAEEVRLATAIADRMKTAMRRA